MILHSILRIKAVQDDRFFFTPKGWLVVNFEHKSKLRHGLPKTGRIHRRKCFEYFKQHKPTGTEVSSFWTPLHDVWRQRWRTHSSCSRSCVDSKKCQINVSAFCAKTFADSQFSPRDNAESSDENLIRH